MKVQLIADKAMNHVVSHISGVGVELRKEAHIIVELADKIHEEYHDANDKHETKFSVTSGDVDAFANMEHPAIFPREFGWVSKKGKIVPGKYTLHRAVMARG